MQGLWRSLPLAALALMGVESFVAPATHQRVQSTSLTRRIPLSAAGQGFGAVEEKPVVKKRSIMDLKNELLDLLPRMTGTNEEFRTVEQLVNELEDRYQPAQTLDFLNLAMQGEWQLLFSTNLSGTPNPQLFRMRELYQRIECRGRQGMLTNFCTWDLAEAADGAFDISGTFTVKNSYEINQGARMLVDLQDHVLDLAKGSSLPSDVPKLVGLLHRAMPKELFDASEHAVDTTYLDGNLRIVRLTGPRLEGVRDIFIRRGALDINPEA